MEQQIAEMMELMKIIHEKVENIESKIDLLSKTSEKVEKNCDRMCDHIQFVESTYNVIRNPLNCLTTRINYMLTGNSSDIQLPQLENK